MEPGQPSTDPLHDTFPRPPVTSPEASTSGSDYLTIREAAEAAGCSASTLRRLVKASEVPFVQEETTAGFRYLFSASDIPLIAHKSAMRRPRGRRPGGGTLQPSSEPTLREDANLREELAALRAERELLRAENARLWAQLERLTETVSRLALPAARETALPAKQPPRVGRWQAFVNWFHGRSGEEGD